MPVGRLKAVLWDMDGVLVDTAPYHCEAWREAFRKRGIKFTKADFRHGFGQRNDNIIHHVMGNDVSPQELEAISIEKEADYRRRVTGNIKPLPGVMALMESLRRRGVKMAIASSAPMANIQLIVRSLGLDSYFQAIVGGQEVTEGKPSPQVFLLATRKLGVAPRDGVVIEDAIAGVEAARQAGMKCLAVTNTHGRSGLKAADRIVDTLEGVTVSDLEALFD